MIRAKLKNYNIILASQSPRRQRLLKELGIDYEIRIKEVEEDFDEDMPTADVAPFLASVKARAYKGELKANDLLITADTTVVLNETIVNKPIDRKDAIRMLGELSGARHTVVTGVCLTTKDRCVTFSEHTDVYFNDLTSSEIEYYIDHFEPYDKAGSYGIQEWLGYIAIRRIDGCFFNVMGLPLHRLYIELQEF